MTTATKTVRSANRKNLQETFKDFHDNGEPEEILFLNNVFETWRASYVNGSKSEVGIASAFENCIRRRGDYVLIGDPELLATVTKFLDGEIRELPATKPRKKHIGSEGAALPAHVKLSSDEIALAVRLARLTRD